MQKRKKKNIHLKANYWIVKMNEYHVMKEKLFSSNEQWFRIYIFMEKMKSKKEGQFLSEFNLRKKIKN